MKRQSSKVDRLEHKTEQPMPHDDQIRVFDGSVIGMANFSKSKLSESKNLSTCANVIKESRRNFALSRLSRKPNSETIEKR
jgi:hypothetical protein